MTTRIQGHRRRATFISADMLLAVQIKALLETAFALELQNKDVELLEIVNKRGEELLIIQETAVSWIEVQVIPPYEEEEES